MKGLTERQKTIFDFINQSVRQDGVSPSYREIAKHIDRKSVATVALHVRALKRKGYLVQEKWRARGLLPKGFETPTPGSTLMIPLLSAWVPAGPTQEMTEEIERVIHVDRYLVRSKDCFAIRVKGVSMTGAGIEEGDVVIVRRQEIAEAREMVIALKDGEATLKRYMPQGGGVLLKAENPKAESYFVPYDEADQRIRGIVGKVIKVIKDVRP